MTVKEFIQGVILVLCMMATGVVLPIGLVVCSAAQNAGEVVSSAIPVIIFEE